MTRKTERPRRRNQRISTERKQRILTDFRMGTMSYRDIAEKHKVSIGAVSKLCKGVHKDAADIVEAGVQYNQMVAGQDEHTAHEISQEVERRSRLLRLFEDSTEKNINEMMDKVGSNTSVNEHRIVQSAIKDGRETVFGKTPDVVVNNSATAAAQAGLTSNVSVEQIRKIDEALESEY